MTLHMDIGQLIIALLLVVLGVVGYLIKLQIGVFSNRLDRHEGLLFGLVGDVQKLIGISIGKTGVLDDHWHSRREDTAK